MKPPFDHRGDPFEETSRWQPATFVLTAFLSLAVLVVAGLLAVGYWRTLPHRSEAFVTTTPKPPSEIVVSNWPAAGFVDTEKRCFMKPEVGYGETSIQS